MLSKHTSCQRRFWKDIKLSKKRDKYAEKIGYASNYTHFHHFPSVGPLQRIVHINHVIILIVLCREKKRDRAADAGFRPEAGQ